MSESLHEQQNREIRNIELKLERIEVQLLERNRKSDDMMAMVTKIENRMEVFTNTIAREYVTVREFAAFQESITRLMEANENGTSKWQDWVKTLLPLIITSILTAYVVFGGTK